MKRLILRQSKVDGKIMHHVFDLKRQRNVFTHESLIECIEYTKRAQLAFEIAKGPTFH